MTKGIDKMTFDEFKQNVETWAKERGIYTHSTPTAQLLKTLSEIGELADAVIKSDREALKDAIGDVAVCLVNYAYMADRSFDMEDIVNRIEYCEDVETAIGFMASEIGGLITDESIEFPESVMALLMDTAEDKYGLSFLGCCEHAWDQIKDRRGRMVPGGAFVKDES